MSDLSGGCVNIDIGTMNGFSCNLVVKSQQDDSIKSGTCVVNFLSIRFLTKRPAIPQQLYKIARAVCQR